MKSGLERLQKTASRTQKLVQGIGKRIKADKITRFNKELKNTGRIAQNTRKILGQVFGTIGIGFAIKSIVEMADTFQNYQNRLKLVTTDTANLKDVTAELFAVADETRSSYAGTAELFTRVSIATKNLGKSQQEVINFTKTLNKAVILSGTTAAEAKNGIIQLSQGLASGALRGDELRSVLEQLPAVADAISTSMGITRGELRKMGEAGKITADVVIDAMAKAAVNIDKAFETTIPTISQAFTQLVNEALKAVGAINEGTGVFSGFAQVIQFVAKNLVAVASGAVLLAAHLTFVSLAAKGVTISLVSMARTAGPLLLVAAAGAAIAKTFEFASEVIQDTTNALNSAAASGKDGILTDFGEVGRQIQSVKKEIKALNEITDQNGKVTEAAQIRIIKLKGSLEILNGRLKEFGKTTKGSKTELDNLARAVTLTSSRFSAALLTSSQFSRERKLAAAIEKEYAKVLKETGAIDRDGAIKKQIASQVQATRAVREYTDELENIKGPAEEVARRTAIINRLLDDERISADEAAKAIAGLTTKLPELQLPENEFSSGAANMEAWLKRITEASKAAGDTAEVTRGKQVAGLLASVRGAERLRDAVARIDEAVKNETVSTEAGTRAKRELLGGTVEEVYANELDNLEFKLQRNLITQREYNDAVRALGPVGKKSATEFGDGISLALDRITDEANDLASVGEKIVDTFANAAVEAIHTLVTQGGLDFKKFASDLLSQIAKIIIRLLIVKALSAVAGAASGGAATVAESGINAINQNNNFGAEARANGGPIEAGRPYLVGEEGPELVVPNQNATVIPNSALASNAPPPPPEVNVSVVNVIDPEEQLAAINSGDLDQAIINVLARNGDQGRQALQQS